MKRRGFLKAAAAALLAPLALVKTAKAEPVVDTLPGVDEPLGDAIDWVLKYAKDPRWDIVSKAMDVMKEGFDAKQHAKMADAFNRANEAMKEFDQAYAAMWMGDNSRFFKEEDIEKCRKRADFKGYSNNPYDHNIQNIQVPFDIGRDELCELGRRAPYHRHVEFPVEITSEIVPSPGWDAYWENYKKCMESQGIDHEKT